MGDSGINEYENVSGGWVGVKIKDDSRRTGFRGSAVSPNGRVMLSEEERVATANAPRRPEDNPFASGALRLIAKDQETSHARPIGDGEPQAPQEQPEPETPPRQEDPPAPKPESEMSQEEIDAHNAKAAKARAVPGAEPPASPPPAAETTAAGGEQEKPQPPEQVATPEAVTAAGEKPKGERAATEQVGTPQAVKK